MDDKPEFRVLIADHVEWIQSSIHIRMLSFITSEPCKIKVLWMVYSVHKKKMECTTHLLHNNVCFNFSSQYTKSQLQTAYNSIYRRYKTITLDIYQLVKIQYGQQTMWFSAFVLAYLDQSTAMASEAPPLSSMLIFSSAIALSSSAILFCSSSIEICNSSTCRRYKHMNRYSQTNLLCTRLN